MSIVKTGSSSSTGREVQYDKLVLATGSYPFVPAIQGNEAETVLSTAPSKPATIDACAKKSKSGAVIGGGLLGLPAGALKSLGMNTHVIEFAPC